MDNANAVALVPSFSNHDREGNENDPNRPTKRIKMHQEGAQQEQQFRNNVYNQQNVEASINNGQNRSQQQLLQLEQHQYASSSPSVLYSPMELGDNAFNASSNSNGLFVSAAASAPSRGVPPYYYHGGLMQRLPLPSPASFPQQPQPQQQPAAADFPKMQQHQDQFLVSAASTAAAPSSQLSNYHNNAMMFSQQSTMGGDLSSSSFPQLLAKIQPQQSGYHGANAIPTAMMTASSALPSATHGTGTQGPTHKNTTTSNTLPQQDYDTIRNRAFKPLGRAQDQQRLSEFLCFLRAECIEVFTPSEADVYARRTSKKIVLNQVGLRCRFCALLSPAQKVLRSSSFPSSIDRIYQSVTMMIRDHFSNCKEMIPEARQKYTKYRNMTKKGDMESKSYWIESAKALGMYDTESSGIQMVSKEGQETGHKEGEEISHPANVVHEKEK